MIAYTISIYMYSLIVILMSTADNSRLLNDFNMYSYIEAWIVLFLASYDYCCKEYHLVLHHTNMEASVQIHY